MHQSSAALSNPLDVNESKLAIESAALHADMQTLREHAVFKSVRDLHDLQIFMRWHVFAVWDFMSLITRLQQDLTCVKVPWTPPVSPFAARLINEIVLGEESDETLDGEHASHFEIYLSAMREIGIQHSEIHQFLYHLAQGCTVIESVNRAGMPPAVGEFVHSTIETALYARTHEVLGSFFYGRKNVIPAMFSNILNDWTVDANAAPTFVYYLKRHIELDGDSHGPAAARLIKELLKNDLSAQLELVSAARIAVNQRIRLWDALSKELNKASLV